MPEVEGNKSTPSKVVLNHFSSSRDKFFSLDALDPWCPGQNLVSTETKKEENNPSHPADLLFRIEPHFMESHCRVHLFEPSSIAPSSYKLAPSQPYELMLVSPFHIATSWRFSASSQLELASQIRSGEDQESGTCEIFQTSEP